MMLPRRLPRHRVEQIQYLVECGGTLADGVDDIFSVNSGLRQCFCLRTADGGPADILGVQVGVQ